MNVKKLIVLVCLLLAVIVPVSAELQTSPDLNYSELIHDAESYEGNVYYIVGDVIKIQSLPNSGEDYDNLMVKLDGESAYPIYILYKPNEKTAQFKYGDTIWARVSFLGTVSIPTVLGLYMTVPVFYSPSIPFLQE